ncbi:MAG: hypothetical protein IJ446_03840 [Oscillospiraceae bacterium]|nr:hypothetical protein [Oscillospiraceae bacterium]
MHKKNRKCTFICFCTFILILSFIFIYMFTEKIGKPHFFYISYPKHNKIININKYDDIDLRLEISSKLDFNKLDLYLCYKNVDNIKYFNNIENLSISSNSVSYYENIDFINNVNITELNISTLYSNDWDAINKLKNLKKICLSDVNVSDMSIFNGMTNLFSVSISSSEPLTFSNTNYNNSIEYLEIKTIPKGSPTEDISGISNYAEIRTLYLINTNICDISELSKLTKLENLYIDNKNNDYSVISNIPNLKQLYIKQELLTKEQVKYLTQKGVVIKNIS